MTFELIEKGRFLMWPLMGCSVLALAIFAERFFYYHRATVTVGDLLRGLANLIKKKNFAEALRECAGTPGPVARVIHEGIIRHELPREQLKEIVQESAQLEVPRLERHLTVLLTIAYIAPLIGMLGTVIGLIDTFLELNAKGFATTAALSNGVYKSLVTSAAGLVVAIPSYVVYSYLAAQAKSLMHDMERGGIEIVNIICDSRSNSSLIEFNPSQSHDEEAPSKAKSKASSS